MSSGWWCVGQRVEGGRLQPWDGTDIESQLKSTHITTGFGSAELSHLLYGVFGFLADVMNLSRSLSLEVSLRTPAMR